MLVAKQRQGHWAAAPLPSTKGYLAAITATPDGRSVWVVGETIMRRPMALRCNTGVRHPSTSGSDASLPHTAPTQLPTTRAIVARRIPVGYGAYDVAAGAGSVWVAASEGVTRIDPQSSRVTGRVRAANGIEWTNVAADSHSVWYLSGDGRRVVVREIDPGSLHVRSAVQFGISNGYNAFEGVAGTPAGVCVGILASHPPRAAVCLTHAVDGGITIPVAGSQAGAVPMASEGDDSVLLGGGAIRWVDLRSGRVSSISIPRGAFVSAVASDEGRTWAIVARLHQRAQLWGLVGGRVVHRTGLPLVGISAIAARDGRVWLLAGSHVYAVSPDGHTRAIATVSATSRGLVATASALWTAQYQAGTVTRISRR